MTPCLEGNAGQNAAQWLKNITWDVNLCDRLPRCSNHHDVLYNSALLTNYTHKRRLSDCLTLTTRVSIRSDRLSENGWHDCGLNDTVHSFDSPCWSKSAKEWTDDGWLFAMEASMPIKSLEGEDFVTSVPAVASLLLCTSGIMEHHHAVCRQRHSDPSYHLE